MNFNKIALATGLAASGVDLCSVLEANITGCDDSRENNQYPSGSGNSNNQYPSGSGGNNPTGSSGNDDLSNQGNNSNNNEDSEKSTPDCNYSYSDDSNPIEASACRRNSPGY